MASDIKLHHRHPSITAKKQGRINCSKYGLKTIGIDTTYHCAHSIN